MNGVTELRGSLRKHKDSPVENALQVQNVAIATLRPNPRNARTHSRRQIRQIAKSMERFGCVNPIIVDEGFMVLAGHGRLQAALMLNIQSVPVVQLSHMSEADKRAYIIADNKLAQNAGWDRALLAQELDGLLELGFEVEITGFETAEIDLIISEAAAADPAGADTLPEDDTPPPPQWPAVTRAGDVWLVGRHRVICGDARSHETYAALLTQKPVDCVFTDPPYNVPIAGHVRTNDAHREFAMASGEMSEPAFIAFLQDTLSLSASACRNGAIAFVCMDWRHMSALLQAGQAAFTSLQNLCVWTKSNGGMGSLYRSQHELVFVFKVGEAPHCNTVELGRFGRNRTNVWSYAGASSFKKDRAQDLIMHPTVKPVAMIEDALKDVTKRNDVVLDPFGGSGSTLIAAERAGRTARLIEIDPLYCDVIVRRFQRYAGCDAKREGDQATFDEVCGANREVSSNV